MIVVFIGIFIIVSIAFFFAFLAIITFDDKELDRKRYRCIENNLYIESDNLINQNKKCKVDNRIIYQIEENGDLVKMYIER